MSFSESVRIYIHHEGGWRVTDEHGEHPVIFNLGTVSWKVAAIRRDGEDNNPDDEIAVIFQMNGEEHSLNFCLDGSFSIFKGKKASVTEFNLRQGHPFTEFFKKVGKHVRTGEEMVIPIFHSFARQLY